MSLEEVIKASAGQPFSHLDVPRGEKIDRKREPGDRRRIGRPPARSERERVRPRVTARDLSHVHAALIAERRVRLLGQRFERPPPPPVDETERAAMRVRELVAKGF